MILNYIFITWLRKTNLNLGNRPSNSHRLYWSWLELCWKMSSILNNVSSSPFRILNIVRWKIFGGQLIPNGRWLKKYWPNGVTSWQVYILYPAGFVKIQVFHKVWEIFCCLYIWPTFHQLFLSAGSLPKLLSWIDHRRSSHLQFWVKIKTNWI